MLRCRRWGEVQVVEFMQQFDVLVVAEPVIAVPKIPLDKTLRRLGDYSRPPQTEEQLLEVPTVVSFSSLQRSVEQNIDIPVPQVREVAEVFKVFVQDRALQQRTWSRSLKIQFLSVGGGEVVVFKVLSLDWVQLRIWSRSSIFLLVEVLKVFSQDRVLPHRVDFLAAPMKEFKGFFALFPGGKKVRGWVRTRGQNLVRTLLHGLRRLMPSPWRAPTTWWRSRRRWW